MESSKFLSCLMLIGILAAAGCAPAPGNGKPADESFPPEELIIDNVKNTDASLAFKLLKVETAKAPGPKDIYGEWKIEAEIIRAWDGNLKSGDVFTFYCGFEDGIRPPQTGALFLGSLKRTSEGRWVVPDNGYCFFPDETGLEKTFEKAARLKKNQ